jgi:hypothetical protein
MPAVQDDRAQARHVPDRTAYSLVENALDNRDSGALDDHVHVYRRLLPGEREKTPRSIAS